MDRSVKAPSGVDSEYREAIGIAGLAVGIPALTEAAGLAVWLAPVLGGPEQDVPLGNPWALFHGIFAAHELAWTSQASAALVGLGVGTAAGVAGSAWAWRAACAKCAQLTGRKGGRERIDSQARWMARGKELADMRRDAILKQATTKLKVQLADGDSPGVSIGRAVADKKMLYASYEDLHLDIWGPRSGKTTSRVIPAVLEAIGAVVATSNKRDVVDATRAARSTEGRRTHVFDPQGVAGEAPTWFWDPIAWVLGEDDGAGAQERAAELAGHFAAGGDGDKRDAFFDPEGEDLLAGLFLACALAKKPITQVFEWVTDPGEKEPVEICKNGGFGLVAAALSAQYNAPDKQRGGVFGTAKKMANCLKFARIHPWVTPPQQGQRPRTAFDVTAFVKSKDTLYPLSKEGKGSAGPLVTALCAAVASAAEREATRHGGRLPVPLLIVLDEAANIVRWADLPKQYSHFGSRGVVVMTILQSWAQGVRCWGPEGMTALWSAANVKTLGAGLDDAAFLRDRAELIGPHYELATSVSKGKGGASTSTSRTSEPTVHASEIAAMPKGRMVVFASGHRPTLVAAVPWWERPYAKQVQDALDALEIAHTTQTIAAERPHLRIVPPPAEEEGKSA
ncbi:TraM recognition domain-containing protein [Nocardia sp. NPDC023852]|uniref:type IV secretory system conjugative DNA transfer family protein n=1 Tax=Nocardia sp. NPDC023852 TaxID=3154697 RepID=UPI0033DB1968